MGVSNVAKSVPRFCVLSPLSKVHAYTPFFVFFSTAAAGAACGAQYGVASDCQLCSVRIRSASGNAPVQGWIEAIDHIRLSCTASSSPCVASIELWADDNNDALNAAVVAAINAGVVMVINAGYKNADACIGANQAIKEAITVGLADVYDDLTGNSNWGPCVDVYAPGDRIVVPGIESSSHVVESNRAGIACKFQVDADLGCHSIVYFSIVDHPPLPYFFPVCVALIFVCCHVRCCWYRCSHSFRASNMDP